MASFRFCFVLLTLMGVSAEWVRADEADDELARSLVAIVRDPRLTVDRRVDAARTLAQMGPKAIHVLNELTRQLGLLRGVEQEPLQDAIIRTIGSMGPAAKSALPNLSRAAGRSIDLDLVIKDAKSRLLEDAASYEIQTLVRQLASRDEGKRLTAAKGLGKLGPTASGALPALSKALADPDADVRRAAVASIRQIAPSAKPSKELIQAIVQDLSDPDDTIRLVAVRTLGKMGTAAAEATAAVQALLMDPDKDVRKAAADTLVKFVSP